MPTINQLVRKGRHSKTTKSNSPALNYSYNSMKKKMNYTPAPQMRGVATRVGTTRTSGHLNPRNYKENQLRGYVAAVMKFRAANPAMWRGEAEFETIEEKNGNQVLIVRKTDKESGNKVVIVFSEKDTEVNLPELKEPLQVKGWIPELSRLN